MKVNQLKMLSALRRLHAYLDIASTFRKDNIEAVSLEQIAEALGTSAYQVSEDFALLMVTKNDERSFSPNELVNALERYLQFLGNQLEAVLVADGFLGEILLKTPGFSGPGVKPLAIFSSRSEEENSFCGIPCYSMSKIENLTRRLNVPLGIVCVPHKQAQGVVDLLVKAGVSGIWNWSGCDLDVPEQVAVFREDDMGLELGIKQ